MENPPAAGEISNLQRRYDRLLPEGNRQFITRNAGMAFFMDKTPVPVNHKYIVNISRKNYCIMPNRRITKR